MNIIFDGNYLFHKTKAVFQMMKEKELGEDVNMTELFADKESQAQFFRKLIIDFCNTVRIFDEVTRVIFVFDNPSWRKVKHPFYKSKEKDELQKMLDKEDEEGVTTFYNLMDKMVKHLTKMGFPVSKILDFEGDDLCFFYAKHYSEIGEKSIIISGDKDLLQFMDQNIGVYRNNSMAPAYFCVEDSYVSHVGETIQEKYPRTVLTEVDPDKHTILKMLAGDTGDNVPNLFRGLGKKTAENIYDEMVKRGLEVPNFSDLDYLVTVSEIVKESSKKAPSIEEIQSNLLTNLDLMWLNEAVYTEEQLLVASIEVLDKYDTYDFKGEFTILDVLK